MTGNEADDLKTGEAGEEKPEAVTEEPERDLAELLEEARRESRENYERFLRARADLENAQKRWQREREEILAVAARHLVERLLPIIDDFSRALAAADESRDFDTLRAGVAMIEQKLAEVLRAEGVEPIEALHQPFDPHWHEALMVEEDDTAADNTVVEVYQKGYKMGGRLLRPSLVRVARSGRQE